MSVKPEDAVAYKLMVPDAYSEVIGKTNLNGDPIDSVVFVPQDNQDTMVLSSHLYSSHDFPFALLS